MIFKVLLGKGNFLWIHVEMKNKATSSRLFVSCKLIPALSPNGRSYVTKNMARSNRFLHKKTKIWGAILRVHCPLKEEKYTANKKCKQEPLDGTVLLGYQHQDEPFALTQTTSLQLQVSPICSLLRCFIR